MAKRQDPNPEEIQYTHPGRSDDETGAELRSRVGLLLPTELAALLGVEVRTLASWRGRKVGPDYVASEGGARIYYRLQDVEAWLEMNVVPTDRAA